MQNSHRLSTIHYTFRCLTSGRELSEITANQVKSAPFAHKSHKLHEICTFYSSTSSSLLSDLRPMTENPRKLEQINQISRSLPTASVNYAKFAESATNCSSNLGVNPVNSRKNTVNNANSAPFALHISKSREIHNICKPQTR